MLGLTDLFGAGRTRTLPLCRLVGIFKEVEGVGGR
jgi:hypothetical protein